MLNSQWPFVFILKMYKKPDLIIFFKLWLTGSQKILTDLLCLKHKIILSALKTWIWT